MKPILKWVGGKQRLLNDLAVFLPEDITKVQYVEPFMGSAALFFHLEHKQSVLMDANQDLISFYKDVRDNPKKIINDCSELQSLHSKDFYYRARNYYNRFSEDLYMFSRSSIFLYLNRACFNGLYRVNKRGEYNVPAGSYTTLSFPTSESVEQAARLLSNTNIVCSDYTKTLAYVQPGSFVYLDPPYAPVSVTSNFTQYVASGFGFKDQVMLRDTVSALSNLGCKVLLSSSDTPFIRDLYKDLDIRTVSIPRLLGASKASRTNISELIIKNY